MTIAFYIDEDSMDRHLVGALRARGVDVQTALEADRLGDSDEEQLEFSASENRVLYSSTSPISTASMRNTWAKVIRMRESCSHNKKSIQSANKCGEC